MINTATSPPAESAICPSPLVVGRTLGTVVVTLHGQVDGSISSLLAAVLRDLIEGQGNQSIVVGLSDVHRLHDSVVDVLLSAAHTSSRQGSHLALSRPSVDVAKALEVAGLADLVVGETEQPRRNPPRPLEQAPHPGGPVRLHHSVSAADVATFSNTERPMTKLQHVHTVHAQSPWLDNLTRGYLRDGTLARMVDDGIRGVTANPTILAKAIEGSAVYDEQFSSLIGDGLSVDDAYWELVVADVIAASAVLRPVFDASGGTDGFVSVEVAPELARDTPATIAAARHLHERIDEPNVFVKIPATAEGVPAIQAMIAEGRSINITLIFSLVRYAQVIEAYLSGLEAFAEAGGDPARVHSVASFFVSRVDTEVDRRLDTVGTDEAQALRGRAAVAQAKLAYGLFRQRFSGERWERLAELGAQRQRPLWASTSTKDPAYPDTLYVDSLIGPDTINTLPEPTIAAFEDHGTLARTIDAGVDQAAEVMRQLAGVGIDMDDVGRTLEDNGVAGFHESFQGVLAGLHTKVRRLVPTEQT